MAGQGQVTKDIAEKLRKAGWEVIYECIPNTPHINVVPIPSAVGGSKQRYPDIVATKGELTRFLEVEIRLSEEVAHDIIERFAEFTSSLQDPDRWNIWKEQIFKTTGNKLPNRFSYTCDLVLCNKISSKYKYLIAELNASGINVSEYSNFEC